jgi:hypothetical protein
MIKNAMLKSSRKIQIIKENIPQANPKSRTMKKTRGKMKAMFFRGGELSL